MNSKTNKPQIRVVLIEETEHWSQEAIRKTGRIFQLAVFDANTVTFLCSVTPAYLVYHLDYVIEKQYHDDETMEWVRDAAEDSFKYEGAYVTDLPFEADDWDQKWEEAEGDYDSFIEGVLEFYRGNSPASLTLLAQYGLD